MTDDELRALCKRIETTDVGFPWGDLQQLAVTYLRLLAENAKLRACLAVVISGAREIDPRLNYLESQLNRADLAEARELLKESTS